ERYAISYVSSGRDLMPTPLPQERSALALIVSDPDYDLVAGSNKVAAKSSRQEDAQLPAGLRFQSLPGFQRAARAAPRLLAGRRDWKVVTASRGEATEERLATLARPRLLYFITHGFFLKDLERPRANLELRELELDSTGAGRRRLPNFGSDARLRSGLA